MEYLLDTNICIYFLKGRYGLVEKMDKIGFENLYISEITVAELKFGVEKSDKPEKNRPIINELIDKFKILTIFSALDIFAKEKAKLKKEGKILDDFDLLIGSTAAQENMVLVTNNEKHFKRIRNLEIENWTIS
ncbi:MAG: type II toxin-antitoxin system VapC family toxin [Bacteroidetes bacterium]|nr:MAG: type II toxin-antitoxin system VapC family toxin [Bacteroidota bacterium]